MTPRQNDKALLEGKKIVSVNHDADNELILTFEDGSTAVVEAIGKHVGNGMSISTLIVKPPLTMNLDPDRLLKMAEIEDACESIAVGGLMVDQQKQEDQVGSVRDFIYRITQDDASSPISESEIEHIARCALRGGYKFDVGAFASAYGRFVLDLRIEE